MSTDFSITPVGAPAAIGVGQPVSDATSSAVTTDLPARQATTATDPGAGLRNDPQANEFLSHQAFFDQAAGSIVSEVINGATGAVVDQFPDDATLQRRAYFRALDMSKSQPTGRLNTDVKA
jgi:hypothetical protein